jgi:cysteine-rich repeat protein
VCSNPTKANGAACVIGGVSGTCSSGVCATLCGNGAINGSETCDDGNTVNGDGCSSACAVEAYHECNNFVQPSVCSKQETNCNDGIDNDGDGQTDAADADCVLPAYFPPCSAGQSLLVYRALGLPRAIPDNNFTGITPQVVATLGGTIAKTALLYTLPHTYDADIDMHLTPPTGSALDVCTDIGSSSDNFTSTVLDSTCATSIIAGSAPFSGCYQPETAFTFLDGTSSAGVWKLNVADDASGDTGSLESWALVLCTTP